MEAVSKWTPKERLQRKPADRELFPGLPLSGFEHVRTFENFSFLKLKVSKRITFKTKASGEGNSTNNFKNFLEPDFILPLCWRVNTQCFTSRQKRSSTRMGFEPTRAEHIGLAVQRLNHSATSSSQCNRVLFLTCFIPTILSRLQGLIFRSQWHKRYTSVITSAFAEKIVLKIHAKCNSVCV